MFREGRLAGVLMLSGLPERLERQWTYLEIKIAL